MQMRDLYLSANLLLKRYGKEAKAHAAHRVQELQTSGDEKGAWVWMGIIDAMAVLESIGPPDRRPTH